MGDRESSHEKLVDSDNPLAGVADMSPNKRYIRWNDIISHNENNSQFTYRAFDTKNGTEVCWHTVNFNAMDEAEQSRVAQCVNIVKDIQHKYVIEYQSLWFVEKNRTLNVVTTILEPLNEFIGKVMTLRWRIVKKWAKQILQGLNYLHEKNIVHRNLTCAHIYINGGTGHTNIGDLWMAAIISNDASPIGLSAAMTTAFTAPESALTSKLDIYSFGMCMLEMITREEPYGECGGSFQRIRLRALGGHLPLALQRISHFGALEFIKKCLHVVPEERPTAAELLLDSFLGSSPEDDDEVIVGPSVTTLTLPEADPDSTAVYSPSDHGSELGFPIVDGSRTSLPASRANSLDWAASAATTAALNAGNREDNPSSLAASRSMTPVGISPVASKDNGGIMQPNSASSRLFESSEAAVPLWQQYCLPNQTLESFEGTDGKPSLLAPGIQSLSPGRIELLSPSSEHNPLLVISPSSQGHETDMSDSVESFVATGQSLLGPSEGEQENISSKLGKALANFQQGENIAMDKGVHDGRNDHDESDLPDSNSHQSSVPEQPLVQQAPRAPDPPLSSTNNGVVPSVSSGGDSAAEDVAMVDVELNLTITIPRSLTFEKLAHKQIEFSFNPKSDKYEEVARAMIEEVHLNMTVEDLALRIADLVNESLRSREFKHSSNQLQAQLPPVPPNETASVNSNVIPSATSVETSGSDSSNPVAVAEPSQGLNSPEVTISTAAGAVSDESDSFVGSQFNNIGSESVIDKGVVGRGQVVIDEVVTGQMDVLISTTSETSNSTGDGHLIVPTDPSSTATSAAHPSPRNPTLDCAVLAVESDNLAINENLGLGNRDISSVVKSCPVVDNERHSVDNEVVINDSKSNGFSGNPDLETASILSQVPYVGSVATEPELTATHVDSTNEVIATHDRASLSGKSEIQDVATAVDTSDHSILPSAIAIEAVQPSSIESSSPRGPPVSNVSSVDIQEWALSLGELKIEDKSQHLEKLDKECRVAKRAFELRIQKHKSIQEKCDDDIAKLSSEYLQKKADLEKKLEGINKKKEEDLAKLSSDFAMKQKEFQFRMRNRSLRVNLQSTESAPLSVILGDKSSPTSASSSLLLTAAPTASASIASTGSSAGSSAFMNATSAPGVPPSSASAGLSVLPAMGTSGVAVISQIGGGAVVGQERSSTPPNTPIGIATGALPTSNAAILSMFPSLPAQSIQGPVSMTSSLNQPASMIGPSNSLGGPSTGMQPLYPSAPTSSAMTSALNPNLNTTMSVTPGAAHLTPSSNSGSSGTSIPSNGFIGTPNGINSGLSSTSSGGSNASHSISGPQTQGNFPSVVPIVTSLSTNSASLVGISPLHSSSLQGSPSTSSALAGLNTGGAGNPVQPSPLINLSSALSSSTNGAMPSNASSFSMSSQAPSQHAHILPNSIPLQHSLSQPPSVMPLAQTVTTNAPVGGEGAFVKRNLSAPPTQGRS